MSVVYSVDGKYQCFTKGAIDELLELCNYILKDNQKVKLTSEMKMQILKKNEELSLQAYRVLGFAFKEIENIPSEGENIENELIFIGLSCMVDPPREDVSMAIQT